MGLCDCVVPSSRDWPCWQSGAMIILRFILYYFLPSHILIVREPAWTWTGSGGLLWLTRFFSSVQQIWWSPKTILHRLAVVPAMLPRPQGAGWIYRDQPGGHQKQWGWKCWNLGLGNGDGRVQVGTKTVWRKDQPIYWLVGDPGWRKILSERWPQPFRVECSSRPCGCKNSHLLGFGFCEFRWLAKMVQEKSSRWEVFSGRNCECVSPEMMVRELAISLSSGERRGLINASWMIACGQLQLKLLREERYKDQVSAQGLRLKEAFLFHTGEYRKVSRSPDHQ